MVDIACFIGEAVPSEAGNMGRVNDLRNLPAGIDYDVCNAEIILTRMSVKDGRIVLPDGMSYALLFLPAKVGTVRPAVLGKIRDLVLAGATLVGNRPSASPSLENYPACDAEVKRIADQLWGSSSSDADTRRQVGAGMVYSAGSLEKGARGAGSCRGFLLFLRATRCTRRSIITGIRPDADIYFVANRLPRAEESLCTFRVDGRSPELWQPDTGLCENGRRFPPAGRTHRSAAEARAVRHRICRFPRICAGEFDRFRFRRTDAR